MTKDVFLGASIRVHHLFAHERRERIYYESTAIQCPSVKCYGYLQRVEGKTRLRCVVCRAEYVLARVKKGSV